MLVQRLAWTDLECCHQHTNLSVMWQTAVYTATRTLGRELEIKLFEVLKSIEQIRP